ncbi:MAG TPA: ABC transporter substrate-binding protein [Burkholderiaceae bacterium]
MARRRSFLSTLAVLAMCTAINAGAAELTKASLRLKWLPQTQFAGYYMAMAKGYYKDEGIDLTLNPGGPNLQCETLVASGADTFGVSGGADSVIAARIKGLPVVSVGMVGQVTPLVFVVRKDGPIKTLEDFRGKKVAVWFNGANLVLFRMLASKGIQPSEMTIQPQQIGVTPFVDGSVDVIGAFTYNELLSIQNRVGADKLRLFTPGDFGVALPVDSLIVSEQTAKDKPELVKAFLRATLRGWQDVYKDPKAGVDVVMKVAPTLDRDLQERQLTEVLRLMNSGQAKSQGLFYLDPGELQKAHDLLRPTMTKDVDLKQAFDGSFLNSIPVPSRLALK